MKKFKMDEREIERHQREIRFEHSFKEHSKPKCINCKARMLHRTEEELCAECAYQLSKQESEIHEMEAWKHEDLEPWTDLDDTRYESFCKEMESQLTKKS